jgi:hypothetical protein
MADDVRTSSDINGMYWVLFKSTGKDRFEYREAVRLGERAILVFTSRTMHKPTPQGISRM